MKVIELTNQTFLVRHWFKWYRVQRSGGRWSRLEPIIKNGKPLKDFSIDNAAESLAKRAGKPQSPPIDLTE